MLTVLTIGYPLAPLAADAVGGAEQIASAIDRALVNAGHRSIVIAPADSSCAGELVPLPIPHSRFSHEAICAAHEACRRAIGEVLQRVAADIVHLHGIDFPLYMPTGQRAVATLHRWPDWYPQRLFTAPDPNLTLLCVSAAQRRACAAPEHVLLIRNGVDTRRWHPGGERHSAALVLGRLCPEKGVHLAIAAAAAAHVPLTIAGAVYPYETHLTYFREQIAPRLCGDTRFIGPVAGERKRSLLAGARCVIVASTVPETSSLVAMEALATGTPVVAFRTPALVELVEHGTTGFLVSDVAGMTEALRRVDAIDREACRQAAVARCDIDRMTSSYLAVYDALAAGDLRAARARAA